MKNYLISIITINLNNVAGLRHTIQSVIKQDYPLIEYVVIDGGSTDGSVDVIKEYQKFIKYWVSEKDSGIYNAMNKGMSFVSGDYVLFLNSGDTLVDHIIGNVFSGKSYDEDILYGDLMLMSPDKKYQKLIKCPDESLNIDFFLSHTLPHQASFFKVSILGINPYREDFKLASDWILFFDNIIAKSCTYRYLSVTISFFDTTGVSGNNRHIYRQEKERYLRSCMPDYVVDYFIHYSCTGCHNLKNSNSFKLGQFLLMPFIFIKSNLSKVLN